MKLNDALLLAAAIGCLIIWGLELQRGATFLESYWLLLASLGFVLWFRLRRVKESPESRSNKAIARPKTKKKK